MAASPVLNSSLQGASRAAQGGASEALRPGSIRSSRAPLLLTPVVFLVHGYHPLAGDAGIYVAGVRHLLDPALYPLNAVFPAAFTRLSVFPWIFAAVVRAGHVPLLWVLLCAQLVSILLFLTACRQVATRVFAGETAVWCSVLLAAACFTLPVAGTALFVMDPYVTARSFSTPLSLMAVAGCLDRAWLRTFLLLGLAASIHPLMAAYAVAFVVVCGLVQSGRIRFALALGAAGFVAAGAVFFAAHRRPVAPAYREAVMLPARTFLFLARWHWYEVPGVLLPLLLFAVAARRSAAAGPVRTLCLTCVLLGTTSVVLAAVFVPPAGPYGLVPFQVLRSFHLIYALGIVLCGGVLAALLGRSRGGGVLLVVLLFAGMFAIERSAWPGCDRIEWPGAKPANPYRQAFLWIRDHTPRDAVFAFNPELVYRPGEDEQGFRAIAERDHLADDKDAGIVAVLPQLAGRWARQRNAELGVDGMTDAQRLAGLEPLGASWVLLPPQAATELPCPYRNAAVMVCRMARADRER